MLGLVKPSSWPLQRQSTPALPSKSQVSMPRAPARCAMAVSHEISRSHCASSRAVSAKFVICGDKSRTRPCVPASPMSAARGPLCSDTKSKTDTSKSRSMAAKGIERWRSKSWLAEPAQHSATRGRSPRGFDKEELSSKDGVGRQRVKSETERSRQTGREKRGEKDEAEGRGAGVATQVTLLGTLAWSQERSSRWQ